MKATKYRMGRAVESHEVYGGYRDASAPTAERKHSPHVLPKRPTIDLSQPGRLRVANVIFLLGISASTFYAGMKPAPGTGVARYPGPDGHDGRLPYWKTSTIVALLES